MPESLVIANTSPLLYLYQVDCLDVLWQLYGTVIVPSAVQKELEMGKQQGVDVPDVSSLEWISICSVTSAVIVSTFVGFRERRSRGHCVGFGDNQ